MTEYRQRHPMTSSRVSRRAIARLGCVGIADGAITVTGGSRQAFALDATPATGSALPADEQLALDAILREQMAAERCPGAVVGIWIPSRGSFVRAVGLSDLTTATPIVESDHFRIASITKTFVATAVLQLVDDGKLGLDDPLNRYVSDIPNGDEIMIRQVLGMTAGIYSYTEDPALIAAYYADPLLPFTPEQGIDIARKHGPDFPPGDHFHYSDTNYLILGLIIEKLTGQHVGDVIAARILQPLGMTQTSFATTPEMPTPVAHGYMPKPNGDMLIDVTRSNPNIAWTAGAMISTLADLRVWAKALAAGTLLNPATQRARLHTTPLPGVPAQFSDKESYGLGIANIFGFIGHNGAIVGYSSSCYYLPEENATFVTLVNRATAETGEADGITFALARQLYPDRILAPAATPAAGTPVS